MKALITPIALTALALAVPYAAEAQEVTYDFSGTVTQADGMIYGSIPLGSRITGTYTFDLANANPAQSSGTVGDPTASWNSKSFGGSFYMGAPTPPVSSVVFSSTASVDGFTYSTGTPSTYLTDSGVLANGPPTSSYYEAWEQICVDLGSCQTSWLVGDAPSGINYTSSGLPDFPAHPDGWSGYFANGPYLKEGLDELVVYSINSLTPTSVPEPATLPLTVLGALGLWVGRRRTANPGPLLLALTTALRELVLPFRVGCGRSGETI